MSHFKAEIHQIRFRLAYGSVPDTTGGFHSSTPGILTGFKGSYF